MRIAIAGATGLIGSQLTALARKEGHEVVEIARETGSVSYTHLTLPTIYSV